MRALDPASKLWMPSVVTRIRITRFFVLNIWVCYIICCGCGFHTWCSILLALGDLRVHRLQRGSSTTCAHKKPASPDSELLIECYEIAGHDHKNAIQNASPPLEQRGKNETEIQIYSRKSELHRARGTPTHKNGKNHTDANIYSWA